MADTGDIRRVLPEHYHSTGCSCCDTFPPRCDFCGEVCRTGLELSHDKVQLELVICDTCIEKAKNPSPEPTPKPG